MGNLPFRNNFKKCIEYAGAYHVKVKVKETPAPAEMNTRVVLEKVLCNSRLFLFPKYFKTSTIANMPIKVSKNNNNTGSII